MNPGDRVMIRWPHPLAGKRGTLRRLDGQLVTVSLDRGGSTWARAELVKPDPLRGGHS